MEGGADRSLARAAGAVSSATMISRVLGLGREIVQAFLFGAGLQTDAFNIAFRIPNMLRDLFAEGALSAAFVPTFTARLRGEGAASAWRLANAVIGVLVVVLGAATLLILAGAGPLVSVLAPGYHDVPGKVELSASMTRILSPFLLFVALAAVMMGVLNVFGRFFLPALAPAVFNAVSIGVTLSLYPVFSATGVAPAYALAFGALAGVVAQFAVQLPAAGRLGFRLRPLPRPSDPGVRRMAGLMMPAAVGLAATQINIVVDSMLASRWEGAVSWLQYAFRLMYLPIGLIGVAIGTAHLAAVSRDTAADDRESVRRRVASALRLTLAVSLPATAGLIALREPIVRTLFQYGAFDEADTAATASVLLAYALGLAGYSCLKIVVPTFYALGDTAAPVRVSFLSVGVKIALSLALLPLLEYRGLPLATSVAAVLNVVVLTALLGRRLGGLGGLGIGSTMLRSTLSAALMGLCCALLWGARPEAAAATWPAGALWLGLVVLAGVGLTALLGWLLGVEEIGAVIRRVAGRLRRGGRA